MKKLFAILTVAVLCVAMIIPALAADTFVSPEKDISDIIISATDNKGNNVKPDINASVSAESNEAKKELTSDKLIEVIKKPATDHYTVKNIFELTFKTDKAESAEVKLSAPDVKNGEVVYILYKGEGGAWEVISATVKDGVVTFTAKASGIYAIITDAAKASSSSPTTGYAGMVAMVSVVGLVSLAGAVYATKRSFCK